MAKKAAKPKQKATNQRHKPDVNLDEILATSDEPKFVVLKDTYAVQQTVERYHNEEQQYHRKNKPDIVEKVLSFYIPNGNHTSLVYPAQMLLAKLKDYSADKDLNSDLINLFNTLCRIDPQQREIIADIDSRDSMNTREYAHRRFEHYQNIGYLSEKFRNCIEKILNTEYGIYTVLSKAILAGIPSLTQDQEDFIRNFGIYHPRLIYVVTRGEQNANR